MIAPFSWLTGFRRTSSRQVPLLEGRPRELLAGTIEQMLADPRAVLEASTAVLLPADGALRRAVADRHKDLKPDPIKIAVAGWQKGTDKQAWWAQTIDDLAGAVRYQARQAADLKALGAFTIRRPVLTLTHQEKAVLRDLAELAAAGVCPAREWSALKARIAFNGGECELRPAPSVKNPVEAREFVRTLLRQVVPDHRTGLAAIAALCAQLRHEAGSPPPAMPGQARWMSAADLAKSPFYSTETSPGTLTLGYEPATGVPVCFAGNESLVTIGGAGSGKSQTQVIPNLLTYAGSAVVLDVKGELWDATAGWRQRHFGPVYRFAPTDPSGATRRYNPFDSIPATPDLAADACSVFSFEVIAENPKLADSYWESRGRDMLWAMAMLVALRVKPPRRNMQTLAYLVGLALDPDPQSEILQYCGVMETIAAASGISDLASVANTLRHGIVTESNRLDSVVDTARRYMAPFARSGTTRAALATSDWRPQDLRLRPGSTVYVCVPPSDLKAFSPLVRLMLAQHVRALQRHQAGKGELPITLFLDEMPQLGNFESILTVQDLGRSAGLRLWMFAQNMGQLARAFGEDRYKGIIGACRVRCFLQPENDVAEFLSPALGESVDFLGVKRPLASADELMGRPFHDKAIVTTRGDMPMALAQRFAWASMKDRILPPPIVPKAPPV